MQTEDKKQIIFSGIQPSGTFTLGNYIGAIRNWVTMQEDYNCLYCIVNMHAITVRQDPAALKKRTLESYALMLACGIDPEKSIAFIQSHVKEHAELNWVLSCFTQFGELSRMTQFKDKSAKHPDNINAGLFNYPVLMAADILLYQADLVPVGIDQKQHLELARDVATRFNYQCGDTFVIPDGYIPNEGAKIASLQEPTKKMSKSDGDDKGCVFITDTHEQIMKKFRSAVTDSESEVAYREGKDGINNLMTIYSCVSGKTMDEIEKEFAGRGYGDFKTAVGEAVSSHLAPVREKYNSLVNEKALLEKYYTEGAEKAAYMARKTLQKVYKKVGFLQK